ILGMTTGAYFLRAGRPKAAMAMFELARVADPITTEAVAFEGVAHHAMGELDQAEKRLREAIALAPSRTFARDSLGYVLLDEKKVDEADATLSGVLVDDRGDAKAMLGRGFAAMERGDLGGAERWFKDGEKRAAEAEQRTQLARARQALDELDRARRTAKEGE